MEMLKIGFIGLGQRGQGLMKNVLNNFPEADIVAVCDSYADRAEDAAKCVELLHKAEVPFQKIYLYRDNGLTEEIML